jgi:membrane-bound lytic murein transglycosylase B
MAPDTPTLLEKAQSFLEFHRKVVADFERSLANARHFINLAGQAVEHEPENTVAMIEQIQEIDLLGHLSKQYEEFQQMAAQLSTLKVDENRVQASVTSVREQYEEILAEAEEQAGIMDVMLASVQYPH